MANLSNINNKFLFTDGDFLKIGNLAPINNISGTESGISITNGNCASITLDNSAAQGKTFSIYSAVNGSLNFYDVDAASGRLVIDTSGNATFAGNVTLSDGKMQISGPALTDNYLKINVANVPLQNGVLINYAGASQSTGLFINQPNGGGSGAADYALLKVNNQGANPTFYSSNNGSTPVIIKANGNVGIGTISPSFQLSIENHATTSSIATFEIDGKRTNGTDGAVGEMIFSNNGDTFATVAGARDGADNSGSLLFQTQNSGTFGTRMCIDSSGLVSIKNVGVPTLRLDNTDTSLGANQTIGDIDFYQSDPSGGGVGVVSKIRSINSSSFQGEAGLAFYTGTPTTLAERMKITSGGELQLGTGAYTSIQFDVDPASHSGNGGLDIEPLTSPGSGTANWYTRFKNRIGGGTTTHNVTIDGKVGIGTTSPGYTLEIAGPSTTSFAYQRTGVSANKWGFHSDNDATYWQNLTSGNLLFTLQNGGNVGIGTTSPIAQLDIAGNVSQHHSTSTTHNGSWRNIQNLGVAGWLDQTYSAGRLKVFGYENGNVNISYCEYYVIRHSGGFALNQIGTRLAVGNGHGTVDVQISGSFLQVKNALNSSIGIARVVFSGMKD